MNYRKGFKNISYSFVGQFVSLALGIFIPRLVIVSYGSEMNGLLSSIGQVMTYLALLEAGLGAAAIQALYQPISQGNQDGISAVISAASRSYKKIGYTYSVLIVGLSFVFPLIVHSEINYWIIWILVLINGMPSVINFLFQGKLQILLNAEGDGYILTNLTTVITVFTSIMKIVMLLMRLNIVFIQLMYCGTSLVKMVYVYYYVRKRYPWLDLRHKPNFDALKGKNSAFLHQVCGLVTNSTDVMLLTIFCDLKAVSIYSVYNMVFNLVYNVVSSINDNVQFILGQAFYKGKAFYSAVIDVYETLYISFASAMMFVTYRLVVPFLTLYTADVDVDYVANSFAITFFLVKILHAFKMISITTGSVAGHFKGTQWHAVGEAAINLVISIIAVNRYGMVGVLFGTIVSFAFRLVVATIYSNRTILNKSCWHTVRVVAINGAAILISCRITSHINWISQSYVGFFLSAIPLTVCALVFFGGVNALFQYRDFCVAARFVRSKLRQGTPNSEEEK